MRQRFGQDEPKPAATARATETSLSSEDRDVRPDRGRSWFKARAADDGTAEVMIYDEIGLWGITAADFDRDLKALGEVTQINLRINSPGGDVFDGIAIFNMLRHHRARVAVTIDGIAASMASVIAMAGDEIAMPDNAMMMIHDPSGMVVGTSGDMRELADALDKVKESLVSAYAKSDLDRNRVAEIVTAETWLTADEALDLGFADRVDSPVRMAANFRQLARFQSVPEHLTAKSQETEAPLRIDLAADMRRRCGLDRDADDTPLRIDLAAEMRRRLSERAG